MLEIFNNLMPFAEDAYRELSVRDYAKERGVSPPTASTLLKEMEKEGILTYREQGNAIYFKASRESYLYKQLAKLYWHIKLKEATADLHKACLYKEIILFGSLAKAENTLASDADLFINIPKRSISTESMEKKLGRPVQLHFNETLKNPNLQKNIEQGIPIQ